MSKPVLEFFAEHMAAIEPKIEAFAKGAIVDLGKA